MPVTLQIPAARQTTVEPGPVGLPLFTRPWYLFFEGLYRMGAGPRADAATVAVGASPYSYTATGFGTLAVTGGTVSLIELGRNGAFIDVGFASGLVPVSPSDVVRITYTVAPVVTFVER